MYRMPGSRSGRRVPNSRYKGNSRWLQTNQRTRKIPKTTIHGRNGPAQRAAAETDDANPSDDRSMIMLRIRQLRGVDPRFGLRYALMSDEPFGLVAKVAAGDQELYGDAAARASLAWAKKLAAVDEMAAVCNAVIDWDRDAGEHGDTPERQKLVKAALSALGKAVQ